MSTLSTHRVMDAALETFRLKAPFRITGYTFHDAAVAVVSLRQAEAVGRGEATGVYYLGDKAEAALATIEACRPEIEGGITREALRGRLPPGGARNAVDCALWALEAQQAGQPVWKLAGLQPPRPLVTTFTLSAEGPAAMAQGALGYAQARALKLKLTGEVELDAERVRAVRAARPDAWMAVDGNQGFTCDTLDALTPVLIEARVSLIEQPLARGREADMDGLPRPIPIAADESVQGLDEVDAAAGRFDVVNIKLDKCGGLTEALLMADRIRLLGMQVMVGNMTGTSLAMGPAFVVGQLCDVVDLDGPVFLVRDREPGVIYSDGHVWSDERVWGGAVMAAS